MPAKYIIGLSNPVSIRSLGLEPDPRPHGDAIPFLNQENPKHPLYSNDKLLTSPHSRAKNINEEIDDRVVRLSTLYQLQSGPRKGHYMGANIFSFANYGGNNQHYVASEAPYHGDDFYRMAIDTNIRVIVSLSNHKDELIATHQPIYHEMSPEKQARCERGGVSAELHHLSSEHNSIIEFDDSKVEFVSQTEPAPVTEIIIKTYLVTTNDTSYHIKHIIYPNWVQYGGSGEAGPLSIVKTINEQQKHLFDTEGDGFESPHDFAIAVNCVYGCGRTNTVIMMHQLEWITQNIITRYINDHPALDEQASLMRMLEHIEMGNTKEVAINVRPMRLTLACHVISKGAFKQIEEIKAFPESVIRDRLHQN